MRKFYFLLVSILFSFVAFAQSVLISPSGDGGFETGTSLANNGWTGVNGAVTTWYSSAATLTSGTYSFVPTGTNCVYLSTSATPGSWVGGSGTTTASTAHFYRDVTFSAGNNLNLLSFRWAAGGEVSWDEMLVYLCPTTLTPIAGSPSSNSTTPSWTGTGTATLLGRFNLSAATGQTNSISIPQSAIGNTASASTMRLVFTWKNDGSGGTAPGVAIDDISLTSSTCATNPVTGTKSVGPSGDYATLTAAINDINNRGVSGNVFLELNASYTSASETFPITLGLNACMDASNTVTIRPASGVSTPLTITSASTVASIDFSGGRFWRIDGRPGGSGTTSMLSIVNTSTATGGSAIRFINDANNNIVTYAGLKSTYRSSTSGVVLFSSGLVDGNDNNVISNCTIDGSAGATASPTASATNGIYSSGSTATIQVYNSGNQLLNNNIFDFFGVSTTSAGILVAGGNTSWTIQGNRIYQTAARTFTSTSLVYYGIGLTNNGAGNMLVTGNTIGFATNAGTGNTIISGSSNMIWGISIFPSNTEASTVSNNTITAFQQTSSRASTTTGSTTFYGIRVGASGLVTLTGNTIGSQDNSTSIQITSTATGTITPSAGIFTNSTSAQTITNNTVGSVSVTGSGTGLGFRGIHIQTSAGVINTVSGNTIGGTTAAAGISISSSLGQLLGVHSQTGSNTISTNTIRNLSHSGANTGTGANASVIGVLNQSTDAGLNIAANTIHSLSATAGASATSVAGIANVGGSTSPNVITRNNIYNLAPSANSSSVLNGILASSGVASYSNNMIRLGLDASGSSITTAYAINGILDQGTNNDYYFNSVHVTGTGVGTTATSATYAFNSAVSTLTRRIQNNIFSNARANATTGSKHYVVRVAGTAASPAGLTLDYNDYFSSGASAVFGFFNGADVASLADWRTAVGQDVNSIASDPKFASPDAATPDLHITMGTPCEGIGVDVPSITVDFDNQLRGANTPVDLGADAGNFISYPIVSFTPLASTCATTSRVLVATVTDADGVPTSGAGLPVLYWRVGAGSYSAVTGVSIGSDQYQFTFGNGVSSGDIISYYVVAQDNLGNVGSVPALGASGYTTNPPAAATPPTAPFSYSIIPTLNGIYTVGAGGTYPTLTAAVAAYNNNCLGGPVTFSLIDGTYPSETFPITILANADASATNTLTIKPSAGVSPLLTGSSAAAIIRLNGADFVTIDGSNTIGGTTRDLTISNTNTGTSSVVVMLSSANAGDAATNNTIRNVSVLGQGPLTTFVGIYSGSGTSIGNPSEAAQNNNQYINNAIARAQYGIAIPGFTGQTGNVVSGNMIGSTISADYIGFIGAFFSNHNGLQFTGNTIQNIITSANNPIGLNISANVINSTISGNTIRSVHYTGTGGYGAKGMNINTGTATSNLTVSNNIVADMRGDGWSSLTGDAVVGIRIGATGGSNVTTGGINLYYNSVHLGAGSFTGNTSGTQSAALFLSSTTSNLDIRNNTFSTNLVNSAAASAKTWAINSAATSAAFTTINNNNYHVSGSQGVLGFLGSDVTAIAALQTAFGGNTNSKSAAPSFVSATDLHLTNALGDNLCLNGAATPIAGITTDIDGQTRNASTPDIGADEFVFTAPTFVVTAPAAACVGGSVDLTGAGVTAGSTAGQTFGYFTDAACTIAVTTPAAITTAGTYYIKATYTSGGCSYEQILPVTVTINALPTVAVSVAETSGTTANDGTICAGGSATLTASGATTYTWAPGGATTTAITVNPATTTVYTVTGTDANGCQNTASSTITVNALPTPSITVAETSGLTNNDGTICAGASASLTAAGGSSYSWSSGETTAAITVSPAVTTTYTVTATDANGCQATASSTITVDALPIVYNVTGGGAYCSGGVGSAIGLSGSQVGVNYELYIGGTATGNIVSGTGSAISFGTITTVGTYTVVASSPATGCISNMSGNATVAVNDLPVISYTLTQPNNCNSNNGGADLTITGAAGPYSYNWTGLGIIPDVQDQTTLRVGSYTVVVTAGNGCQATANFTLFGPGGCDICPTIGAATTAPAAICQNGTATLSATGLADLGISYGIDFVVSSTPLANPYTGTVVASVANGSLTAGGTTATTSYTFTSSGNQYVYAILSPAPADPGCRPFKSVQINVVATPDVNTVANQTVCSGALTAAVNFSGSVPGTTYTWTNNNPSIGLAASGTGNISSFTASNFTNAPVTATITVTPQNAFVATSYAYVPARQTNSVSVINTSTNLIEATIPVGLFPNGVWASSSTNKVYVTNIGDNTVSVIDANTNTVVATIPVGNAPWGVSTNAAGTRLYVSNRNDGSVSVVDATNNTVISTVATGTGPIGTFVSPDETKVFVSNLDAGTVSVIDAASNTVTATIGSFTFPLALYTNRTGTKLFVSNYTGNSVSVVDIATNTITGSIPTGPWPVDMSLSPDGTKLYLSVEGAGEVYVIDVATNAVLSTITGLPSTAGITVTPDGNKAVTAQFGSGNVSILNLTNNTVATTLSLGAGSQPAAFGEFILSPASGTLTCPGPSKTFTITVNPTPTVNTVAPVAACNGASVSVPFTGFVPGTVYEWTNSNTAIGLAASGTGNLSFTGTNAGTSPISGTIIVTPKYTNNGQICTGTPIAFTITINPTPTVNTVSNQVVCNSGATTAVSFSGAVTGTTYSWTNSAPSIGLAASGTGNIASFTAVNTGTAPVTATITVTPNYTNGGTTCSGTTTTFTITVNPQGQVNTVSNQTICNGANTTAVNFSTNNTGVTTTYSWTNSNTSIGLAASGSGNIPSFAAVNTGTTPVTATVTVTPSFTIPGGSGGFTPVTIPSPVSFNVYDRVTTYTGVSVNGGGNAATVTPGSTVTLSYNYSVAYPGGFCPGCIVQNHVGLGGSNQTLNCVNSITNGSNGSRSLTFTAPTTPGIYYIQHGTTLEFSCIPLNYSNNPAGGGAYGDGAAIASIVVPDATTCTGTPTTFTYTVNPTPTVNAVSSEVVCNNASTSAVTFSGAVTGTVYNWTNSNTAIGLAASGTGNIASFTATNSTSAPITATITVTPSYTNGGVTCTGTSTSYTITVNPTPTVNTVSNQTLCNGAATTAVAFSGAVTGTVYNWTNNNTSIGLGASGSGNIASFTATNTTNAPVTATITVTPSFLNGGTLCTGTPTTFTITVNPTPNAVATPAVQTICSANAITGIVLTGNVTGTTYSWTRDNTTAVTGIAASGTGNITGTLTNTTNAPVTVTFTITPSANGCTGTPITATVLVNPTPNAVATPAAQTICSGSAITTIALTGNVAGTTYSWTRDNTTAVTGIAASGTGNITGTLTNTTTAPVTVTFTITPSANGCTGAPITATVIVNPIPTVNAVSNQVVCNRSATTAVAFTGAVTGTVYSWTNNTPSIGLAASGTGNIAAFTAVNTTQVPVVATITVTPSFTNGGVTCTGTPRTFTITVNPTPIVVATDLFNQRICISDAPVALNATPVGGSWSGIGVSGFNFVPSAAAVGNFVLTYTYTNQFGCTSTDTTTAKVSACDERNRSLEAGGAILYPNPNGGQFNVRVNSTRFQFLQMRIYNALGQLVSTKQWNGLTYGQILPVDMRHLAAGVYTVRVIYDGGNLYEDRGYQMLITH